MSVVEDALRLVRYEDLLNNAEHFIQTRNIEALRNQTSLFPQNVLDINQILRQIGVDSTGILVQIARIELPGSLQQLLLKVSLVKLESKQYMCQLLHSRLVLVGGRRPVLINQIENTLDEHIFEIENGHAFLQVPQPYLPKAILIR